MPSEKTATERLRELLDERGVEWWNETDPEPQRQTNVWISGQIVMFHENANGTVGYVVYSTHDLTPEQAIAATLGDIDATAMRQGVGTCKQEERGWTTEGDHARVWFTCGHDCMVETVNDLPNYCPVCGRKVVFE